MALDKNRDKTGEDFLRRISRTVSRHKMLAKGDRVVCAVSGGMDSVVMLEALGTLARAYSLKLLVCHLNHNLRGAESRRDFDFVKKLAASSGLEFYGCVLKKGALTGASVQDAARTERMRFLAEAAAYFKADRIATGHTLDDNAETVLMRLIGGSGLRGLGGIHPRRGLFIRPLIETSRADIARFAKSRRIANVEDSSNATDKYLRNSVRHALIPRIVKSYNPNFIETVNRTASILRSDEQYLSQTASAAFKKCVVRRSKTSVVLDRRILKTLGPAILSRVMMLAVEYLLNRPAALSRDVHSFSELIGSSRPNASFDMHGLRMYREYDYVVFEAPSKKGVAKTASRLSLPGDTAVKGTDFVLRTEVISGPLKKFTGAPLSAYFDLDGINTGLVTRTARPGDRLMPLGMKGHKKLKEIFIDNKIPVALRRTLPVVCAGKEIIWVAGIRQSELFKINSSVKRVLKISLLISPENAAAKKALRSGR